MSTEQATIENLAPEETKTDLPATDPSSTEGHEPPAEKTPEQVAAEEKEARIKTELDKENHDIRRMKKFMQRAAQAEAERDALKAQLSSNQQPSPANQVQKPTRDQFADDLSYVEALTDWKVEQKTAPLMQARESEKANTTQQQFRAKENAFKAETPDYDEVISEATDVIVPNVAVEAILTSDYGPQLRYYFAKHPEDAAALSGLSIGAAARKVGVIEAKIAQEIETKKTKTKATPPPPPINPPGAGGDSGKFDPNKLSDKDWFAREQAELRKPRK